MFVLLVLLFHHLNSTRMINRKVRISSLGGGRKEETCIYNLVSSIFRELPLLTKIVIISNDSFTVIEGLLSRMDQPKVSLEVRCVYII